MEGDRSLVAGRSQREKRRSYKDLLREEEEIAAQVRKTSKKRLKVRPEQLNVIVVIQKYLVNMKTVILVEFLKSSFSIIFKQNSCLHRHKSSE